MASGRTGWVIGVAISCALFVGLTPAVCSAGVPAEEQTYEPIAMTASPRRWYGWQTFAADGVAGAFFLAAVADNHNDALFALSGVTFALGAPTIHLAHGRWDVGLGSLGLRILGPLVGVVIGAQSDLRAARGVSDANVGDTSSNRWAIVGAGIGGLVASAIDGVLLAYDTRVPSPRAPRNQQLQLESLPTLVVLQHGVGLGYSGEF